MLDVRCRHCNSVHHCDPTDRGVAGCGRAADGLGLCAAAGFELEMVTAVAAAAAAATASLYVTLRATRGPYAKARSTISSSTSTSTSGVQAGVCAALWLVDGDGCFCGVRYTTGGGGTGDTGLRDKLGTGCDRPLLLLLLGTASSALF